MERLTKAEEEIMHLLWESERATVSELIGKMPEPHPPHSTISSIMRILERKNVVGHKAYGRTYEYFPLFSKDEYRDGSVNKIVDSYFGGSVNNLVSFLVGKSDLSLDDLETIRKRLEEKNK